MIAIVVDENLGLTAHRRAVQPAAAARRLLCDICISVASACGVGCLDFAAGRRRGVWHF